MKFQNRAIITKTCELLSILLLYITILSQVIVIYVVLNSLINVLLAKEQVVIYDSPESVHEIVEDYIKWKILSEKRTVDQRVPGMLVIEIMVKKSREVKMTISKTGLSLQILILIPKVTSNHKQKTVKLFHFMSWFRNLLFIVNKACYFSAQNIQK